MEDTPNLFDSNPVAINIKVNDRNKTVVDDVLNEILNDIQDIEPSKNLDIESPISEVTKENTTEYCTDNSDNEEANLYTSQIDSSDKSYDELMQHNDDTSKNVPKAKDSHKGLPPGRVKLIMKMDPDVNIIAGEAVFLVTKATESFVGLLAEHCHKAMVSSNKKTLQRKHIDAVIEENLPFEFLEGTLDW
ncbi:DNA polymerase epsilon subunit 4 [Daktulosphaira vitifoliae]|uniref:DNA polymerase epsilon subunit 4 n=1 Tax=Daktulosphaira vitifoliae TaxID=58002 RepID=UPI0021AA2483|nr:DNA polymerase epsilon subunit 4 [Daktulosphaira vitifoliae]